MVLERLKEYIDAKGITVATFEKAVGLSNASFRKALQAGKGMGTDKLENILSVYDDLSAEWLFRGIGPMLKDKTMGSDRKSVDSRVMNVDKAVDILHNNQTVIIGNWDGLRDIIENIIKK